MKHIIVGTAGHVDHGKSTLIRSLTGINPDRLKEEQQRGLTIDIGFAWFDLPSGRRAGIVDVPGHEKFIKNMLAGAMGFDVVLLVIAADEGIMPQTKEHLNILSLLKVKNGLVVLTKIDTVDEEWCELVKEDIREQLQDTFLANSPIIPVSAPTGIGLDILITEIDRLTQETLAREINIDFRMPIDRSFSIRGFGTVVTGTLLEGQIKVGDLAEIQPLNKKTRVRNIQIHSTKAEHAYAGQRVALNLADVTVEECQRGQVLSAPKLLRPTMMLDVMLRLLQGVNHTLKHWDRVRVYTGTAEVLGRIVLFGCEEMWPGEELPVQIRLEEPLVALRNDRYVIRTYSPLLTIGGGHIIDANPSKKRRFKAGVIDNLQLLATGSSAEILMHSLLLTEDVAVEETQACKNSGLRDAEEALEELIKKEKLSTIQVDNSAYIIVNERLDELQVKIKKFLAEYHQRWPLREGASRAEVRSRFLAGVSPRLYQQLLVMLAETGDIYDTGEYLRLSSHQVEFTGRYAKIADAVLSVFEKTAFSPPGIEQIAEDLNKSIEDVREVINAYINTNKIVKIAENYYLLQGNYLEAQKKLVAYLQESGSIDLATFRNFLQTSRKYALPLLELFDQQKITRRSGDIRVLYSQ